jgi:DNA-binding transcriptional LysR family regulator
VPLFDRSERKLRLTAHGEIFLRESNKVLNGSEQAISLARRSFRGEVGTLRIGFFAGGVGAPFAGLIRRFRTERPEVQVSLTEMRPGAQTQALLDGSIDIAFTRRVEEPFARVAVRNIAASSSGCSASGKSPAGEGIGGYSQALL